MGAYSAPIEVGIEGEVMELRCLRCGEPPAGAESGFNRGLCGSCYSDLVLKAASYGGDTNARLLRYIEECREPSNTYLRFAQLD